MSIDGQTDATIRDILTNTRRIAVVGASDKTWRPSHGVFGFLLSRGYDATPVNPALTGRTIHGRTVVARLADAAPLDMVDVFRASRHVGTLVDEAAAARARAAGITVVMDRCPVIEERRLGLTHH